MNVSTPHNRDLHRKGDGDGKQTNPDRTKGQGARNGASADSDFARGAAATAGGEHTDEQLLAEYRQGDRNAFAQLMARYQRELYHFLVRFLGDRAAAED